MLAVDFFFFWNIFLFRFAFFLLSLLGLLLNDSHWSVFQVRKYNVPHAFFVSLFFFSHFGNMYCKISWKRMNRYQLQTVESEMEWKLIACVLHCVYASHMELFIYSNIYMYMALTSINCIRSVSHHNVNIQSCSLLHTQNVSLWLYVVRFSIKNNFLSIYIFHVCNVQTHRIWVYIVSVYHIG